ncbi:TldD/PmbA family protein [Acrocarpospora macrocephala]|uniref:Peptidase U62 n=1 Tax=Acrocarpospora macrocephala TaxID=150177 RepID=A0A5M3WMQ9_9ACTN|nr:TldD/PmbA family protein [Acrocarpospora macrocephala]GES09780.1 peptidase U62 [Acrocarpospora macrocephala]
MIEKHAERLLALARRHGATDAEVSVETRRAALTRFANSEIHQSVAEDTVRVNLRYVHGRRHGMAATGRLDDAALESLVERAAASARGTAETDDWPGLPEPGPIPEVTGASAAATRAATPELRAGVVREVIAAADAAGVGAFGSFATGAVTTAVLSSRGVRAAQTRSDAWLVTVHMSPDGGTGYAETCAVDVADVDGAALGREAAAKARAGDHAVALAPGEYPVVLEEYAVVDLLAKLGRCGFNARAAQEGQSCAEPGVRIASDLVTVWDDGTDPAGLPTAFDYEGVGKQRVTLIDRGRCAGLVHDTRTAAGAGIHSTGHALPAPNPVGPLPTNMFMAPGGFSREELLGRLDRGLLVTRFYYTNPVDPKRGIVTGVTRDGLFLVEGGEIVGPVRDLRFSQSYLDVLRGVSAVGNSRRTLRGWYGGVSVLGDITVPAVLSDSFRFSG